MWLAALVCMTTKMAEVCFAVATRRVDHDGKFVGGPMYYICLLYTSDAADDVYQV